MRAISFQNKGLIDPRCITIIGVSVKEGENPIGFFGTGLKYAIAIILRNGGSVEVFRGTERFTFDTIVSNVRGTNFQIVRMNGQELGFTTELGKHWKMWQAFREIYCNTIDEDGFCGLEQLSPQSGYTTITVRHDEFVDCYHNLGQYILQSTPTYKGTEIEFHPGPSNSVFYRSIKVAEYPKPFLFVPNILSPIDLTEDRTMRDTWALPYKIAKEVLKSSDTQFIERWLTAQSDFAEHELDLDWSAVVPSSECIQVMQRLASDLSITLNPSVMVVLSKHKTVPLPEAADLLPTEQTTLDGAIKFCKNLKYPVDEFPITVVESLGQTIMGRADTKLRRIYIAREALQMGTTFAAVTLLEEWAHIKHGFADCERPMQNWLFNQIGRIGEAYLYELHYKDS